MLHLVDRDVAGCLKSDAPFRACTVPNNPEGKEFGHSRALRPQLRAVARSSRRDRYPQRLHSFLAPRNCPPVVEQVDSAAFCGHRPQPEKSMKFSFDVARRNCRIGPTE
jgi:hypothetical protein